MVVSHRKIVEGYLGLIQVLSKFSVIIQQSRVSRQDVRLWLAEVCSIIVAMCPVLPSLMVTLTLTNSVIDNLLQKDGQLRDISMVVGSFEKSELPKDRLKDLDLSKIYK